MMMCSKFWILRVLVELVSLYPVISAVTECPRGQVLHVLPGGESDVCVDCGNERFMPVKNNVFTQCFKCQQILKPHVEILKSPCNKTRDAVIHCTDGYFRTNHLRPYLTGVCQECKECSSPISPCQRFSDTVCSTSSDVCLLPCRRGEFFDPPTMKCFPCPPDTFMDQDRHANIQCTKCAVPRPQEKILQPCNGTHPPVIYCGDGFYRQRQSERCMPCRKCPKPTAGDNHEESDQSRDISCCLQPDRKVVTPCVGQKCPDVATTPTEQKNSPKLRSCGEGEYLFFSETSHSFTCKLEFCGEGEYLSINENTISAACKPCPTGTYMDKTNHTKRVCLNCADEFNLHHCFLASGVVVGAFYWNLGVNFVWVATCLFMMWYKKRHDNKKERDDRGNTETRATPRGRRRTGRL